MALPFESEPMLSMRARYHAAVRETFALDELSAGIITHPRLQRQHVFDVRATCDGRESGIRLVLYRLRGEGPRVGLYISAEIMMGPRPEWRQANIAAFGLLVFQVVTAIAQRDLIGAELIGLDKDGAIVWVCPLDEPETAH